MTRRAIVQKWILYCLCALVLLAVQDLILVRIRIGGVHPFLLPALAVAAGASTGRTVFRGAARLRLKESDRLASVAALLRALGCAVDEGAESLTIHGSAAGSRCCTPCSSGWPAIC